MKARKIKDWYASFVALLAIILLTGVVFVPVQYFALHASLAMKFILVTLPFYLIIEAYYFVKDTPKRREAQRKKKSTKKKIFTIIEWSVFVILIILLILAQRGSILKKSCPETIQGNPDGQLTIKYFFNPFCTSCWKQEIVVQDVLQKYINDVRLERYDLRYCAADSSKFGLRTLPAFVFQQNNQTENFGLLTEERMEKLVCEKINCQNR